MREREHPARILVVDDDRDIRLVLIAILEGAGYHTDQASNGLEALDRVRAEPPDLVMLDLSMPRLDGIEVMRRLKADSGTAGIPIVMVTASGDEQSARAAVNAGAFAYVLKPWDDGQIERTVAAALSRRARGSA
jgi:two-component system cell cycle response regulator